MLPIVVTGLGVLLSIHALRQLRRALASRHWPSHPAVVLRSSVRAYAGRGRQSYEPIVRYEYRVNGERYESGRITFAGLQLLSSTRPDAERVAGRFPVGTQLSVRVDPSRPHLSVVDPGVGSRLRLLMGLAAGLLALGAALFYAR